jgi:flagellar basal-body rod modification protein FlgD
MTVDFTTIGKTSSYISEQEASKTKKNNALDQEDFLKLLTTQLSNQDPSSPVDNNQMVTTMSQLSVVDSLNTITKGMDDIVNSISSSSALSASSLVGRSVLVNSKTAFFDGNTPLTAQIDGGSGATDVKVTITDAAGQIVSTFSCNAIDGETDFSWDGIKNEETGETYDAGKYTVTATGYVDGSAVTLPIKTYGTVGSVVLGSNPANTKLNILGYGEVALDNVEQISL